MNNEEGLIKEATFYGSLMLSVISFFLMIVSISEYNQLYRENEVLKERIKEQTTLIEYLEKEDGEDEGITREDS